jgi:Flp pilus assembly pilin Flp
MNMKIPSLKRVFTKKNKSAKSLINNEKGQGTAEYVLLLVIVVALAFAFKGKITSMLESWTTQVDTSAQGVLQQ